MNTPTPAIVAQAAARRLPRVALFMLCLVYVLAGFVGRDAWKSADVAALGYMTELAQGSADWLYPTLMGIPLETPSLLPYWLGAWAMQGLSGVMDAALAARLPFLLLLMLAMASTWYGSYYLARSPRAQPVAFAFGGEAQPKDYARAMADGALLALMACLGLAQLGHETTSALAQLGFSALLFFSLATLHYHTHLARLCALAATAGLGLSGAPAMALLLLAGGVLIHGLDRSMEADAPEQDTHKHLSGLLLLAGAAASAYLNWRLDLWRWKVVIPPATWAEVHSAAELLIWFTWPTWPLALWTVWRWRRQLFSSTISRHVALPLWFVLVSLGSTLTTSSPDRSLMLGLPALAALATFALPTLKRQVSALIDWFTLVFFCGCGFIIWVVWIAMQTGFPPQPAANVARLAPGFVPQFSVFEFAVALAATAVWAWLVQWRVGRHRAAIWKSLALPAGGAVLCWTLLMTLWMPLLNYTQSYNALVGHTVERMQPAGCVEVRGLSRSKLAAFQVYSQRTLVPMQGKAQCPWLIDSQPEEGPAAWSIDPAQWDLLAHMQQPSDGNDVIVVYRRK